MYLAVDGSLGRRKRLGVDRKLQALNADELSDVALAGHSTVERQRDRFTPHVISDAALDGACSHATGRVDFFGVQMAVQVLSEPLACVPPCVGRILAEGDGSLSPRQGPHRAERGWTMRLSVTA